MRPGALKRALVVAGCGALTVTVSACESTEQESAKIASQEQAADSSALKLGAVNRHVHVSEVTLVSGGGRMAVAAKLTSSSTRMQANLPLLLSVTGTGGKVLYTNATPGLEASLQHMPSLAANHSAWWVDDQVLTNQRSAAVKVEVGTGGSSLSSSSARRSSARVSSLTTTAVHIAQQDGVSVLSARLVNRGAPAHSTAAVFAVALKGGRVVAAGRAIVQTGVHQGASTPFQIFLVGNAAGAEVELTAVPVGRKPIGG